MSTKQKLKHQNNKKKQPKLQSNQRQGFPSEVDSGRSLTIDYCFQEIFVCVSEGGEGCNGGGQSHHRGNPSA